MGRGKVIINNKINIPSQVGHPKGEWDAVIPFISKAYGLSQNPPPKRGGGCALGRTSPPLGFIGNGKPNRIMGRAGYLACVMVLLYDPIARVFPGPVIH